MKNLWLPLLAFFGLIGLSQSTAKPRGISNNNPLNIRDNPRNNWQGKIGVDEKGFVIFNNAAMGARAAHKILNSYQRRGIRTLYQIVSTWAPPSENPTGNYARFVSERTGIPLNARITDSNRDQLLEAMAYFENGQPVDIETIRQGAALV